MKREELMKAVLRLRVQTGSLVCLGCGHENNCGIHGCAILRAAANCIQELSAKLDDMQKRYDEINDFDQSQSAKLLMQIAERDKQLGLAVERAKLWGKNLIESNSDAHVTICTECGFPIPDYGVDTEIWCSWCKAKSRSDNYAPAGPGYCKTTLDRKAKDFDKIFHSGRGGRVDDDVNA